MRLFLLIVLCASSAIAAENIMPDDSRAPRTNALPWQFVGYRGTQTIPTITSNIINLSDYGGAGDGATINDQAMTNARLAVARGGVIYLGPGTWIFTNGIYVQNNESFVIRGAGMLSTKILSFAPSSGGNAAIRFEGGSIGSTLLTADALRGATNISVTSTSGFAPGLSIRIDQTNDVAVMFPIHPTSNSIPLFLEHSLDRLQGQYGQVHSISSGTVTLTKPLYWDYKTAFAATLYRRSQITNCGVEDIMIEQRINGATGNSGVRALMFYQAQDCWAKNVGVTNAGEHGIVIGLSYQVQVEGCQVRYAQRAYQSAYAYQVNERSTDCLIQNNIADLHSSGFLTQGGAGGNVFGYNYSPRGMTDAENPGTSVKFGMISHGDFGNRNLFEGNVVSRIASDNYWGNNSHLTWLRNWARGYQLNEIGAAATAQKLAVEVDATNYFQAFIGNIVGYPVTNGITSWTIGYNSPGVDGTPDPQTAATLFRHGNYDFIANSLTFSNGFATNLPSSYYLAAKPSWFGSLGWPPIGPDVPVCLTSDITNFVENPLIPAVASYHGISITTNGAEVQAIIAPAINRGGKAIGTYP